LGQLTTEFLALEGLEDRTRPTKKELKKGRHEEVRRGGGAGVEDRDHLFVIMGVLVVLRRSESAGAKGDLKQVETHKAVTKWGRAKSWGIGWS